MSIDFNVNFVNNCLKVMVSPINQKHKRTTISSRLRPWLENTKPMTCLQDVPTMFTRKAKVAVTESEWNVYSTESGQWHHTPPATRGNRWARAGGYSTLSQLHRSANRTALYQILVRCCNGIRHTMISTVKLGASSVEKLKLV